MNNRIFVDSSILIEYRKGSKTDLWDAILSDTDAVPCLNQTVVSEYLFHHMSLFGGKSPMSIKESGKVETVLLVKNPLPFLELLEWLPDSPEILPLTVHFMKKHNLLPNDAIILSTCKKYGITALASHDADFSRPCQAEDIHLLSTVEEFTRYKASLSSS
ncbi:MAG: type II toxin-antitoxin system VapC family toxin [Saprospiraceae bacterium]